MSCISKFNEYGISLYSSFNNICYNNYFANNILNAQDNGINRWNITITFGKNIFDGPYLGGNFWSDYTGEDLDGDGLGDTNLPYGPGDYHPLVEYYNQPPVADFTYTPVHPTDLDSIQFNDISVDSDGTIASWIWDFGDGSTSALQNPTHDYTDSGTYHVTLSVMDDDGLTDTITTIVEVLKEVTIDIKPGDYPNSINVKSKGNVPVAILTTDVFDASNINPNTVEFLDASPYKKAKLEDVDKDGDMDMILQFKTQELDFSQVVDEGDKYPYAYLIGDTIFGAPIQGKDTVKLIGQVSYGILELLFERFPHAFPILRQLLGF